MRDEKRKRESDTRGKSERGLEVVSGRGGIHLYILDAVYIPLNLAYLSTNVFSFDFPSSEGPDTPVLRALAEFRLFGPFIFSRSGLQGCPNDGLTTMADPAYCFSLGTIKLKPGAIDRLCPRALTRRRLWRASCRLLKIGRLYRGHFHGTRIHKSHETRL